MTLQTSTLQPASPGPLDARAVAVMTLLCVLWSLQQISLKAVAGQASPMLLVALRSLIGVVLLAALMARRAEVPARSRWPAGALAGGLFALEYLLVTAALNLTQASHVVVFLYTAPLFAALGLHWKLPAERLNVVQWSGIGLAFGGITLAFLGGDVMAGVQTGSHGGGAGSASAAQSLLGDALALLAGAAWGATTITIRCSNLAQAPATETLLYQLLGAFVLLLPVAVFTGQVHFEHVPVVWAHLAFQALIVSFASFLAWFWLLRRYLASQLGVFSFLTPLFGVVLGVWLLGESLTPPFVAGSALVLGGIALVSAHGAVGGVVGRLHKRWRDGGGAAQANGR
ncbi:MAG: EamA family transporter [Burkholderiales bacterium PBB6]|nr:MAG: EamA family transporter [Burkholderiales bacterium PBB6]